jgi:hypothetical protein
MIRQILSNNNEKCYRKVSLKFFTTKRALLAPSRICQILSFFFAQLFVCFSRHASVFLVGKGKRDGGDGSRQYLTQEIFTGAKALFSSQKFCKIFSDFSSHQIFGHMHEALNIDKK